MPSIKIPWQVLACAGLVLFQVLFGWYWYEKGSDAVQKKWDQSISRGSAIVEKLKSGQGQVTTKIEYVYRDRVKVIHEEGKTITKLVPHYIPAGTCELPGGFRVLHDAAVTGTIPEAPGRVDEAPVPVETAAITITENYTTCREAIADLEGMRTWAAQQYQLYLDQCKQRGVACNLDN